MPAIKFVLNVFHLCLWNWLITDALAIEVRQSAANKTVQNGEKKLLQPRSPRLIQHIPYYTTAAGQQSNVAHNNVPAADQPQRYLYESDDIQPQIAPPTGYVYVPVAYLPGIRTIAYSSHPPPSTTRPRAYEHHRHPSTASNPIHYSTTTAVAPTAATKIPPASVFDRFPPPNADTSAAGDYSPPPKAIPTTPSLYNVKVHPVYTFEYQQPERVPVFANVPPSQYLNFRYSNLRQAANAQPSSTTPATVEITSPKHYIYSTSTTPQPQTYYVPPAVTHYAPIRKPEYAPVAFKPSSPSHSVTQAPISDSFRPESIATTESRQIWYNVPPNRTQTPYSAVRTGDSSAYDILSDYNNNNHRLPERITPENLKESIRTLSYILQMLRKADSITQFDRQPSKVQHGFGDTRSVPYVPSVDDSQKSTKVTNHVDPLYDTYESVYDDDDLRQRVTSHLHSPSYVPQSPHKASTAEQNVPGRAGIDYPTYSVTPETTFSCKTQRYKGFFADPDTKCQVWHYCDLNGGQASFLCPNGTIFSQVALTCDWWFNVKCAATPQLYVLNERLYKYIIPMRPSFPEDYSGPLVDKYLTEKFKEIESQRKHRPSNSTENDDDVNSTVTTVANTESSTLNLTFFKTYDIPTHLLDQNLR